MALADDIARLLESGGEEGLLAAGHAVLEEAKRNLPIGDPDQDPDAHVTLAESGHVEVVPNQFGTTVRVSFDAPYAAKQHEDLRLKHPRGGGPKYLEHAVTAVAGKIPGLVAARVDTQTARRRRRA
jgi:hypothetical protein